MDNDVAISSQQPETVFLQVSDHRCPCVDDMTDVLASSPVLLKLNAGSGAALFSKIFSQIDWGPAGYPL